jgi:hypothetical protein
MGSVKACSGIGLNINSCQIACLNPHSNQCYAYNGFFIDGTPCGIGGICKSGACDTRNIGKLIMFERVTLVV